MRTHIVVLCFLADFFVSQDVFGQKKDVQAVETFMDHRPLEISVEFKGETFYFFLTFQQVQGGTKSWKLLVSKNKGLLTALQSQADFDEVLFQSIQFTNRGHKRLWRRARDKFNIDRYVTEPYILYEVANTSLTVAP
jgi:hypothetical protein